MVLIQAEFSWRKYIVLIVYGRLRLPKHKKYCLNIGKQKAFCNRMNKTLFCCFGNEIGSSRIFFFMQNSNIQK